MSDRPLNSAAAWAVGTRLTTLFCAFTANGALARLLSQSELGAYFVFAAMVPIAAVIISMGLDKMVVMRGTAMLASGGLEFAKKNVGMLLAAGVVLSLLSLPVIAATVWLGGTVFVGTPVSLGLAIAVALWAAASGLRGVTAESFRAFHRFGFASLYGGTLDTAVLAVLLLVLLASGGHHDLAVAVGCSCAAVTLVSVLALLHATHSCALSFRMRQALATLRLSASVMGASVALFFLGSGVDVLLLSVVRTDSDVANYGAAARLATLTVILYGVVTAAVPSLYVHLRSQRRHAEVESLLRVVASLAALPSIAIVVVYVLFGELLLSLIFGPAYTRADSILLVLSLGHLSTVLTGPSALALILSGEASLVTRSTLIVGGAAGVLGLIAAWAWGGLALAIATAGAIVIQNAWLLYQARSRLGLLTMPTFAIGDFRTALGPLLLRHT